MINDCVIPSFIPRVVKLTSVHHPQVDTYKPSTEYLHHMCIILYHSCLSALQKKLRQQTSRVVYPKVLQIVPDGAKFCPHDFDHPQPCIWLNSCLGRAFSTAHASIVNMAGQEILIYCVFLWNAGCVYQCSIWNSLSSWLAYCSGKMFSEVWELRFLHARPWIPGDEIAIFTAVIH